MWEQIAVRIVMQLIYQRLRKKELLQSDQRLQTAIAEHSVVTIKDLETTIRGNSVIEDEVVSIGAELADSILKTGIHNILKLLLVKN